MDQTKIDQKSPKKKKANLLSRISHRISKAFSKSKSQNVESKGAGRYSKQCKDDLPVTSKSHDDLEMKEEVSKTKRKKFRSLLSIPPKNDRCLSEGDLSREDDKFYSDDSSPKSRLSQKQNASGDNDASVTESHNNSASVNKRNFKNELALKLRSKQQQPGSKLKKDDECDSPKTPDSPARNCNDESSPVQPFNESRTPHSLSSLSHSSNSLLSASVACNYGTSDGESINKYIIDSTDEATINVDLATPISKTTTATLLDSTAARQKIAASRPRRVRPKANAIGISISGEKLKDLGNFSPVREKRELLEEITEEDCQPALNPPNSADNNLISEPCSKNANNNENIDITDFITKDDINNEVVLENSDSISHQSQNDEQHIQSLSSNSGVKHQTEDPEKISNITSKIKDFETRKDNNFISTNEPNDDHITTRFKMNKMKFEDQEKIPKPTVALRNVSSLRLSTTSSEKTNELNKIQLKHTSWAPISNKMKESTISTEDNQSKDVEQIDIKLQNDGKVLIPLAFNKPNISETISTTSQEDTFSQKLHQHSSEIKTGCPESRKSRVFDIVKNIESVS